VPPGRMETLTECRTTSKRLAATKSELSNAGKPFRSPEVVGQHNLSTPRT